MANKNISYQVQAQVICCGSCGGSGVKFADGMVSFFEKVASPVKQDLKKLTDSIADLSKDGNLIRECRECLGKGTYYKKVPLSNALQDIDFLSSICKDKDALKIVAEYVVKELSTTQGFNQLIVNTIKEEKNQEKVAGFKKSNTGF